MAKRKWHGAEQQAFQPSLWRDEQKPKVDPFPKIRYSREGFLKVLEEADTYLGLDYEFDTLANGKYKPTVIGISNNTECAAIKYDAGLHRMVIDRGLILVGHSVLGAERKVILDSLGIRVPLDRFEDSMRATYWANLSWSKAPDKNVDTDETEQGSGGFMGLYTCASYYTMLPQWKEHRGLECWGPCPVCEFLGYCSVDSYAGLHTFYGARADMERKGIPFSSYRDRMVTGEVCQAMQDNGVRIDLAYVDMLEGRMELVKNIVAPTEFNARSPKQIAEYFGEAGINLDDTDKDSIHKALEHICTKKKIDLAALDKAILSAAFFTSLGDRSIADFQQHFESEVAKPYLAALDKVPAEVAALHRLYTTKGMGKGVKAGWADDKYLSGGDFIHPRWVDTATMTTRLASAKPNCFDEATEILTDSGWVFLKDLQPQRDKVAQWWKDGHVDFTHVTGYIFQQHTGNMVSIQNEHIDLRVTDDHRCLLRHRKTGEYRDYAAIDYSTCDHHQMHSGICNNSNGVKLTDAELRFLIAVQADANLDWQADRIRVDFVFRKQRKLERLRSILADLGLTVEERAKGYSTRLAFTADSYLSRVIAMFLGENKVFGSWVLQMSRHQMDVFCEEIFHWDGRIATSGSYSSNEEENVDWAQAVLVLSGKRVNKVHHIPRPGALTHYMLLVTHRDYSLTANAKKTVEHVDSERVYCVSVPSSYVIVRRNGKVMVTGQCTNIPARGWGKAVKRMIIPRDESLDIISSDRSQLELRVCLWLSGVDPSEAGEDAFTFLQKSAPEFDKAAEERQRGETGRDLAKITSHLSDYGGGVKILSSRDLDDPRIKREISYGCLRPYLKKYGAPFDWEYGGGVVAFTGVILAENLFGNKTQESRKRALVLQEDIFYKAFPMIRGWQRDVSHYIEAHGCVRSPDGRMVELYDTPEENLKKGTAWLGQGVGAAFMTGLMRRYWLEHSMVPILVVHDDMCFEIPKTMSDKQARDLVSLMDEEVACLPGFKCPGKTKRGPNWGDCKGLVVEK